MAAGFPGFIGRPGFRGGYPHAARRMLSYQDKNAFIQKSHTKFKLTTEEPKSLPFKRPQNYYAHHTRSLNSPKKRSVSVNNNLSNSIVSNFSHTTSSYKKYISKGLLKGPRQQRYLLWSPPQIISSVLKVFRKVLSSSFVLTISKITEK